MAQPPASSLPHGSQHSPFLVELLDRIFHFLLRMWAVIILGGLAISAMLSLVQNGASGLTDPSKYLVVYLLLFLVFAYPVVSLATIGALLLLTAVGGVAHIKRGR